MTDNMNMATAISPISDKIEAFGTILRRIEDAGIKTVPILTKIERNTSRLSKLYSKHGEPKGAVANGEIARKSPGRGHVERVQKAEKTIQAATIVEAKRVKAKQVKAKQIDSTMQASEEIKQSKQRVRRGVALHSEVADIPIVEVKRDRSGKYVGKSKKHEPVAENETPTKQRSKIGTMAAFALTLAKDRSKGGKDTAIEAVGRALGGPIVDAIIDVKQHYDRARDTVRDVRDKYGKFKGEDPQQVASTPTGSPATPVAASTAKAVTPAVVGGMSNERIVGELRKEDAGDDKTEEQHHKELIKAILSGKDGKKGKTQTGTSTSDSFMPTSIIKKTGPGAKAREKLAKLQAKAGLPPIVKGRIPGAGGSAGGGILSKLGPLLGGLLGGVALPALLAGGILGKGMYDASQGKHWGTAESGNGMVDAAGVFEVGGGKTDSQAAATISSGKGDAGGKSYGIPQLSSKRGEVDRYLQKSGYASQFTGMQVGTPEFDAKWKSLAESDPNFAATQKQDAIDTKYRPQLKQLQGAGIDLSGRGQAVQNAIFSTANQYGANSTIIQKALKGKDLSNATDENLVSWIQDYKAAHVEENFRSSSPDVKASVAKRIQREKKAQIALARGQSGKGKTEETQLAKKAEEPAEIVQEAQRTLPEAPKMLSAAERKALDNETTPIAEAQPVTQQKEATPILASAGPSRATPPESFVARNAAALAQQKANAQTMGGGNNQNVTVPGLDKLVAMLPGLVSQGNQPQIRTEFDDNLLTMWAHDVV